MLQERLAVAVGIVSLAIALVPVLGLAAIPGGFLAAILGIRARSALRVHRQSTTAAVTAIVTGVLAAAIPMLMLTLLVAAGSSSALASQSP